VTESVALSSTQTTQIMFGLLVDEAERHLHSGQKTIEDSPIAPERLDCCQAYQAKHACLLTQQTIYGIA
jgi:hypothetical protein